MATRHTRSGGGGRPRRRWAVTLLATLAGLAGLAWIAPAVIVHTDLRDRPLALAFAGLDGSVSSRAAAWRWWGGIEYRDVVLRDRDGRPLVAVPRVLIDRGLAQLLLDRSHLGAVRLIGGEALVEVRRGGSTIEDVLAPWLAAVAQTPSRPLSFELEVVDAAIELVDLERRDAWRITDLLAAGSVRPDATLAGWTISGRVRHAGEPVGDLAAAANRLASDRAQDSAGPGAGGPLAERSDSLDRTTVAAGATAILARDGGWAVSSPDAQSAAARTLAVAATRIPLGLSSVAATRFDSAHVIDGLADVRLDITLPPPAAAPAAGQPLPPGRRLPGEIRVAGVVSGSQLAVCRADTLAELVAVDRVEMPFDLAFDGNRLTVRSLQASSRLFQAEASGRIRMPTGGSWDWAEAVVGEDFAMAADVDLAAAARALPGGLAVRPDVRVTGGMLQLSAASRADGNDRVLELRAAARELAAVQSVVATRPAAGVEEVGQSAGAAGENRLLRWSEPFTGWVRGRRGPGRGARLRIEEARIASAALEASASGTADSSTMQWTLDLDKLGADIGELLDLGGVKLAGEVRGRVDLDRVAATGASHARVSASLSNFTLDRPGRPAWRDAQLALEAEGSGGFVGGAVLVDRGHAVVSAADDSLEITLTGGALVNPAALLRGGAGPDATWLRAAAGSQPIAADLSLQGDLARWQPRWEGVLGHGILGNAELGGLVKASAALAAQGDSWQVTRAGGEVEKLTVKVAGRQISESRVVASAAGRWNPARGQVDVSSAEFLTATMSLRTGGLSVLPRRGSGSAVERLRGRVQWQADVGRLERWLVAAPVAARWPAGGRAWGTAEILDTPIGLNVLVEATGSQLTLASKPTAGNADPQPLWTEPRAAVVVEFTCPRPAQAAAETTAIERLTVNQLKFDSSTVAVSAAGGIGGWSSRREVELAGSIAYDWEQVTRLLTPWTGGRLRLAGGGARPFTLRGPLGRLVTTGGIEIGGGEDRLTLPADWLGAGRDADPAAGSERFAKVAAPVTAPRRSDGDLADRLRAVSLDTSAAWTAAEIAGFECAPGEMSVRLFEGQLALGPFDVAASGGRVRGAPWLRLLPLPGELVVPPGRCLDRVMLTRQMCDRWVSWIVPLLGQSTQTQGLVSVDLAGARLPLDDPFGGEAAGQLIFENLEATPGDNVRPLVNLIVKLQSAIDPRFAFGDKAVLLRVRPEPVRVRLAERRLWHEGLVMDAGQLVIRSAGSVGSDGTLAMVVELALRGDIAGTTPVVAQLLRTPLAIPLRGTVSRPQFDARSIDMILGRIVENTAEAVIGPSLSRGLETLFGNPQPPEVPPPAGAKPLDFPSPAK